MPTRRSFVQGIARGAGFCIVRSPMGAVALLSSTTPAAAYWAAVFAAVQVALSILSSMSKSDGGIGAMLSAQQQLLSVVISQLTDIQKQLTNLTVEVMRLEEKFRKITFEQYRDELITGIGAAAGSYAEVAEAARKDPATFNNPAVLTRLGALAQIANTNRNSLSIIPGGFGPEAALTTPIALALEVSCSSRIGFGKDLLISILSAYKAWLKGMLEDRPGSIVRYRAAAVSDYDTARLKGSETRLGTEFKLAGFTLDKLEMAENAVDYCVLFSDLIKGLGDVPVPKENIMMGLRFARTRNFGNRGGTIYERFRNLQLLQVESLKASQISFEDSEGQKTIGIAHDGTYAGPEPKSYKCYVRGNRAIFDRAEAIKFAESPEISNDYAVEMQKFQADFLDKMNLARARIAFADKAAEVVRQTSTRAQEQIEFLGGG